MINMSGNKHFWHVYFLTYSTIHKRA